MESESVAGIGTERIPDFIRKDKADCAYAARDSNAQNSAVAAYRSRSTSTTNGITSRTITGPDWSDISRDCARVSRMLQTRMVGKLLAPEIQSLIDARNFVALRELFDDWPPA